MDGRSFNVFLATFLIAAIALFGAWFAVDGLVHLDEFFGAASPDVGVGRVALRHYGGVISLHGGTLLGAIGLGSALVAVARARRPRPLS
jgi:hypothetical protein